MDEERYGGGKTNVGGAEFCQLCKSVRVFSNSNSASYRCLLLEVSTRCFAVPTRAGGDPQALA